MPTSSRRSTTWSPGRRTRRCSPTRARRTATVFARSLEDLGLADRVTLDERYLDPAELAAQVAAADIVLLPYDSRDQVTSGVLVEAVAAGKPVVATGFPHAVELLAGGGGHDRRAGDPAAIAAAVRDILTDADASPEHRRPVAFDPDTGWSAVAAALPRARGGMTPRSRGRQIAGTRDAVRRGSRRVDHYRAPRPT